MLVREINFDGLVGPTHNYAGLSPGNIASMTNRGSAANPRSAALQGIAKMRFLYSLGLTQGFLPPLEKPDLGILARYGFTGSPEQALSRAMKDAPGLFVAACSASSMWTANAATVTPATDAANGTVHFTPANLVSNLHRSFEPEHTGHTFRAIFADNRHFTHHEPLPGGGSFGDEGAANHTRLAPSHSSRGLHVFVYGQATFDPAKPRPRKYVARQTLEASQAVARLHGIPEELCLFVQQSPDAIDAGVFHNDVIATGNEGVFLYHEEAFAEGEKAVEAIRRRYAELFGERLCTVRVPASRIPLEMAVKSYLFNTQVITLPFGEIAIIAPLECAETPDVCDFLDEVRADPSNPIAQVYCLDLRGSMRNGGGPACLRLRVVLGQDAWIEGVADGVKVTPEKADILEAWVKKHYREELCAADMATAEFVDESRCALDELTQIMGLGPLYPFQKSP